MEWTAAGAEASHKHLSRVWRLAHEASGAQGEANPTADAALERALHKCIHEVSQGIESFGFNAAIAKLYAFTTTLAKTEAGPEARRRAARTLAQLMAPMVPHLAEEIWALLGGEGLCAEAAWPKADPALLVEDSVTLPIQVNGKRRGEISVPRDMAVAEIERLALEDVARNLDGAPKKVIVVPGRIVNVVA